MALIELRQENKPNIFRQGTKPLFNKADTHWILRSLYTSIAKDP